MDDGRGPSRATATGAAHQGRAPRTAESPTGGQAHAFGLSMSHARHHLFYAAVGLGAFLKCLSPVTTRRGTFRRGGCVCVGRTHTYSARFVVPEHPSGAGTWAFFSGTWAFFLGLGHFPGLGQFWGRRSGSPRAVSGERMRIARGEGPGVRGGGGTNRNDKGLNLSGSWQQGHSAAYNTPSRI
ncbi:UNVERIFIED_CONTAM: hypothetical protein Slati_2252800 [Sesamum latifolium]|uniref:Uncharacterized protein n=1 Tax=Sesamum latifolium TaxID=2727402 RepID=A0AAW2WZB3_9LAMI